MSLPLDLRRSRLVRVPRRATTERRPARRARPDRRAPAHEGQARAGRGRGTARLQADTAYGSVGIPLDPWQAADLAQRLRGCGVKVEEWPFTSQSVGRLGATLHLLLRDHRLALPDDRELLDELMTVRLRESAPGVYRLDHDSGQHDDRAVALGLAALALTERPAAGIGIFGPRSRGGSDASRPAARLRRATPHASPAEVRAAQRTQTPAQRRAGLGFQVPGSANDPRR